MTYNLKLNFTSSALTTLAAQNKKIVVVKESNEPSPISGATIAWFTTQPFQQVKITWENDFYLYATQTEFKAGAVIDKSSSSDNSVVDGSFRYNFGPDAAIFQSEAYSGSNGTVYMKNLFTDGFFTAFGLAQKISSGSKTVINPINAVKGIYNDNIAFTPIEKIRVFMQANIQDSKVLTEITSDPIKLDFTGKTEQEIVYNEAKNIFVLK